MKKPALGRVLDPEALLASAGPRARLRLAIPSAWAEEGATLALVAPLRLGCARCEGGGCDGCGRSGVLRAPEDPSARALTLHVPAGQRGPFVVRLVEPFGPDGDVEQLLVEIVPGIDTSDGVNRLESLAPARRTPSPGSLALALVIAVLTAITALYATHGRH